MDKHRDAAMNKRTALEQLVALVTTVSCSFLSHCFTAVTIVARVIFIALFITIAASLSYIRILFSVQARTLADKYGAFTPHKIFPKYSC